MKETLSDIPKEMARGASVNFMKELLLTCPDTGEKLKVTKVSTKGTSLVVEVGSDFKSKWKHTIKTIEA